MTTRTRASIPRGGLGAIAAVGLLATACLAENMKSDFPPGLDPLEATNLASFPDPVGGDPYPEMLGPFYMVTSGPGDRSCGGCQYVVVHAKAYVKRPLADVWAAGVVPQTTSEASSSVDTCNITLNVETGYDYSWLMHYTKSQSIAHVEFDVTWRSGTLPWPTPTGGPPQPLQVAWRFQKTNGTQYIKTMAGSVLAYDVPTGTPGLTVTALEFIRHVQATQSPQDVVASGIQNHYDNILAQLDNPAAPAWTNRVCTGP